jgi:hypothetical protein
MNRGLIVLLLGLGVGVATHVAYFQMRRAAPTDSLDGQLAWIKGELRLSDAQYARIRELHEASSPKLRALAAQVSQMQVEFAAFENTRRATDRVDFVEFAQFVEARRAIDRECLDSTHRLVMAAAGEMNPSQREHYFGLVAATTPQTGPSTN